MAFSTDPYKLLADPMDLMIAAKQKASAAQHTFSGPRYTDTANDLWDGANASRSSGRAGAYTSGTPSISNIVPSTVQLPQGNSEEKNALYTQRGSDALKSLMGTGLSQMPRNFATLKAIGDQTIDNLSNLRFQEERNDIAIAQSELGAGGMSTAASIIGGIGSVFGGFSPGSLGGGASAAVSPAAPGGDVWGATARLLG